MLSWPNIMRPSYPLQEDVEDPTIRTPFENGMEQTRPRFTRLRKSWVLRWNALKQADYTALMDFLNQVCIGSDAFYWTHPQTGVNYTVRVVAKQPFSLIAPNLWSGEITLREV